MSHLEQFFQDIIDQGGEGIILRNPASLYEPGRSTAYLKHKVHPFIPPFVVIANLIIYRKEISRCRSKSGASDQWTWMGMWIVRSGKCCKQLYINLASFFSFPTSPLLVVVVVGSFPLFLSRPNQVVFTARAGTAEFVRRYHPKPGDIVSFKHRGFLPTTNKPKLPLLYRLRSDLTWDTVVANWKDQKPPDHSKGMSSGGEKKSKRRDREKGVEKRKTVYMFRANVFIMPHHSSSDKKDYEQKQAERTLAQSCQL